MARDEYRKDPLGPASWLMGHSLHKAHRFEEAVESLELALRAWPDFPFTLPFLAASHLFYGEEQEAIETARKALDVTPDAPLVLAYVAATLGRAGQEDEAREVMSHLDGLPPNVYLDPYNRAIAHAGLDEHGRALDELERLVEEGSPQSWAIPPEPFFDPLRAEPRFDAVLEELDLPRLEF